MTRDLLGKRNRLQHVHLTVYVTTVSLEIHLPS